MKTPHLLVRTHTRIFSRAHLTRDDCTCGSRLQVAQFSRKCHLFIMSLFGVLVSHFSRIASSPAGSLSRPSASSTPLATRSLRCVSARWTPDTESDQLKIALHLYVMEIHLMTSMPDCQKLKTMAKRSTDQKLRFRNFDVRHKKIETGAVVTNRKGHSGVERG